MAIYNHKLCAESRMFTGTEHWYRHPLGILLTDGSKWLAETLDCYWLLDEIAIFSRDLQGKHHFMAVYVEAPETGKLFLKITDGNKNILWTRKVNFTDLYIDAGIEPIRFYLIEDGGFKKHVLLLPSEY